ncbi:hypothetical protein GCM10011394_13320 [Luteimonas terricola]|uniref:Uncharacterized protein n=1 Tax=Luteimonas terricola TaxID=645597 RepID=A0ABQ2ECA4_9GAMM|nr:hypothetical protein GCM10011394_13320 [Luteimonas terricola]
MTTAARKPGAVGQVYEDIAGTWSGSRQLRSIQVVTVLPAALETRRPLSGLHRVKPRAAADPREASQSA